MEQQIVNKLRKIARTLAHREDVLTAFYVDNPRLNKVSIEIHFDSVFIPLECSHEFLLDAELPTQAIADLLYHQAITKKKAGF